MGFFLLTNDLMIAVMFGLMKALNHWINLKKAIAKIRKMATVWKQPLNDYLFLRCCTFISIFIASNAPNYITHFVYFPFMLASRITAYSMCSVLLFSPLAWVDLGLHAASKMECSVT